MFQRSLYLDSLMVLVLTKVRLWRWRVAMQLTSMNHQDLHETSHWLLAFTGLFRMPLRVAILHGLA
eukprot:1305586-Amphidinium_carterae.1